MLCATILVLSMFPHIQPHSHLYHYRVGSQGENPNPTWRHPCLDAILALSQGPCHVSFMSIILFHGLTHWLFLWMKFASSYMISHI